MNAPERKPRGKKNKARAEWTLRAGQTQGEVALGFHNSSGKLSDETSRKNWIDALLAKLDIVGVCELGADASVQAEMEAAQRQLRDGYKAVFGRGTRAKSGMALLVSNRLATTTVQHVYDDGTGHTLIANVNVHGRLPLLIVLSHAPASTDGDRERYFTDLLSHIPEPDPRHPDRRAVWLGDFNFEEGDGTQSDAYEKMLVAYAAVCRKLGSEADGGLLDAYRIAHSDGSDTTRGDRRIDRGLIDSRLVGGLPGLADADHIHQTELQVVKKGGKLGKKPDHKAVRITLRFSDTERPKPAPRYDPRRISADRLKVLDAAITPLLKDATCDPELTEDKMQCKVAALFDGWNKADRKARNHERHVLVSKIDRCERGARESHGDGAKVRALRAQAHRLTLKLQRLMLRMATQQVRLRQRQRWQREQGANRALFDTLKPEPTINLPLDEMRVKQADGTDAVKRGQEQVAASATEHWKQLFNRTGWKQDKEALKHMLQRIAEDEAHRLSAVQAAKFQPEAMFTSANFLKAMKAIQLDTSPGESGITTALLRHERWRQPMAEHLARLALKCYHAKEMTGPMKTSIISILYKGGDKPRERWASHRPVSLTDVAYRVMDKVVEQYLSEDRCFTRLRRNGAGAVSRHGGRRHPVEWAYVNVST